MTHEATYAAFDRAFSAISAYLIMKDGRQVGRVAFKHGASVQCFAQIWGCEMQRGKAGGGGYDRASAAAEGAFRKMAPDSAREDARADMEACTAAIAAEDGWSWAQRLEHAGYVVQHVFG